MMPDNLEEFGELYRMIKKSMLHHVPTFIRVQEENFDIERHIKFEEMTNSFVISLRAFYGGAPFCMSQQRVPLRLNERYADDAVLTAWDGLFKVIKERIAQMPEAHKVKR